MDWNMLVVDAVTWLLRAGVLGFAYFCGYKMVEQVPKVRSQVLSIIGLCGLMGAVAFVYYQNYSHSELYPIQKSLGLTVALVIVALQGQSIGRSKVRREEARKRLPS